MALSMQREKSAAGGTSKNYRMCLLSAADAEPSQSASVLLQMQMFQRSIIREHYSSSTHLHNLNRIKKLLQPVAFFRAKLSCSNIFERKTLLLFNIYSLSLKVNFGLKLRTFFDHYPSFFEKKTDVIYRYRNSDFKYLLVAIFQPLKHLSIQSTWR